ncbi:MAG: hypothetical protein JAY99_14065 [Candidatus Thiodiazotropha lotti]|nr:hypothetical protein [Candidatus Thiodiazotropha endoloripes]MCG7896845.1 hypothetical protein [Candidatus Thiodiazotropha weberae]MCG7990024.1 hypothetical protein [Candidatus Thiodiazotropha lotti]MCG7904069.1 hypothetical protein [Candidatus Thiodiazotropha weberae]MCG8000645.1 hypothetical protein [Candidatus Thiodiazotropha lotti]MCW4181677.1 hypothetical protein [Candidatus Thiodiazotropha weberae]
MEIASFLAVMMIGALLLLFKKSQSKANAKQINVDELQEQIETALSLPGESDEAWQNEPATEVMLNELAEKDIRLNRELSKGQAMNILGLFSPPDGRQVDILKHFNIPYSFKMNQTMAHYVIREIFSDPAKVEEWNNRPPTTTVRQGLLFMEGKLVSGLTHEECQSRLNKLGMDHPDRYQEWKQIDRLFLETNNPEVRAKLQVRKITWKRFFESYEVMKDTGINPRAMRGEHIIEYLIRNDDKILANDKIREAIQPATT